MELGNFRRQRSQLKQLMSDRRRFKNLLSTLVQLGDRSLQLTKLRGKIRLARKLMLDLHRLRFILQHWIAQTRIGWYLSGDFIEYCTCGHTETEIQAQFPSQLINYHPIRF